MERDVEYNTIVLANNTAAEIDNEISLLHVLIAFGYNFRFLDLTRYF